MLHKYDRLKDSEALKVDESLDGHYELETGRLFGLCHCWFGPFKWELGSFNAVVPEDNGDYFALLTCCLLKGSVFKNFKVLAKEFVFSVKALNKSFFFENKTLLLISDYLKDRGVTTPEKLNGLRSDSHFRDYLLALVKGPSKEKVATKYHLLFKN